MCGDDCKFKAKGGEIDLDALSSGKEESAYSAELEADRRAEERIESWNSLGRERQAQDEVKRKTMNPPNSNESPNQVCVTLTTHRNREGRITGTSCSRAIQVPAHQDMNPPDLSALTNGDEEYLLVKVSKNKRRCWVTYLDGEDPDVEREFYIGTTVSGLLRPNPMAPRNATRDAGSPRVESPPRASSTATPSTSAIGQDGGTKD